MARHISRQPNDRKCEEHDTLVARTPAPSLAVLSKVSNGKFKMERGFIGGRGVGVCSGVGAWFFYLLIYYLDSAEIVDIFTAEVLVPLVGSHIPV